MSAFLLDEKHICQCDNNFIFYGNQSSIDEAVCQICNPNDQLLIDLSKIPDHICKIVICLTIYDTGRRYTFIQFRNIMILLSWLNNKFDENGEAFLKYCIDEKFSEETVVLACEFYRNHDKWMFKWIGEGYKGCFENLIVDYGLNLKGGN